jgi:hypothetical protein
MFEIKVVVKIKTHVLRLVPFFPENRAVYEIMSKNVMDSEKPQMIIWRRVAFWVGKATRAQSHASARAPTPTHTHALTHAGTDTYVILIAFPRQQ